MMNMIKRRLLIPTLTVLAICSQVGPMTAMAATNDGITALLSDAGTEISIVIDEDMVVPKITPYYANSNKTTTTNENKTTATTTTSTKENKSKNDTYSSDGRIYYGGYTGTPYATTKALSEYHKELKKDIEDYFGTDALYKRGYSTTLYSAIVAKNSPVRAALNSKTQRLKLGDIAVENKLVSKNNTKASHLIGLFTYYGIINTEDGLLDYSNSTTAYLSRAQGALILGRFMVPQSYVLDGTGGDVTKSEEYSLLKNKVLASYIQEYSGNMLLSRGKYGYTKENLESSMTRLEFIYMLMNAYFPEEIIEASKSKKTIVDIFSDIDKDDVVTFSSYNKKLKLLDANGDPVSGCHNKLFRQALKDKKIVNTWSATIEAAYGLGILVKDSKGKADLFQPVTMSQALRMLAAVAEAIASGKAYN